MCNVYRPPELEPRFGQHTRVIEKASKELVDSVAKNFGLSDWHIGKSEEEELKTLADALEEMEKFQKRKLESSAATSDVLFMYNHIRGKKFAVLPVDQAYKNPMCYVQDTRRRAEQIFIRKNQTETCVEIADYFFSRVVITGLLINEKVGITYAQVQDAENNTKSLPVDETAFLFDEQKLGDWIRKSTCFSGGEGENLFQGFVIDRCYVMMLE